MRPSGYPWLPQSTSCSHAAIPAVDRTAEEDECQGTLDPLLLDEASLGRTPFGSHLLGGTTCSTLALREHPLVLPAFTLGSLAVLALPPGLDFWEAAMVAAASGHVCRCLARANTASTLLQGSPSFWGQAVWHVECVADVSN
ncbi:hypothetical protein P7K49_012166 [Saguinus oedipus]|uniref:Uncharacterized protein n=1 Tax=Saguinus oedipus TaxID=9490 RepID=A0ABQ9VUA4_SAGOE|nr:hypothetical protein P7K49_012166 [Saguinus oedipus]